MADTVPRIGLVGARRKRQGLGHFMAAILTARGCNVAALLGTTEATADEAMAELHVRHGLRVKPYTDLQSMIDRENLDALVIASPADSHLPCLRAALAAGLHVLCEKPFVWGVENPTDAAESIVGEFQSKNLVLMENVQWPYTLPTFRQLHPNAYGDLKPVDDFGMLLCPAKDGEDMLVDTFSHVFSMLQTIAPGRRPTVYDFEFERHTSAREDLTVRFNYIVAPRTVRVEVRLKRVAVQPRPAWVRINGCLADRAIQLNDYSMQFVDNATSVPLPDPMHLLLADFDIRLRAALAGGPTHVDDGIVARMDMLEASVAAYRETQGGW